MALSLYRLCRWTLSKWLVRYTTLSSGQESNRIRNIWAVRKSRYLYNMLGLIKQGKVESAEKIFQNMLDRGVRPDTISYNTLLSGYVVQGDVCKAFRCFNNLKKRGLRPSDHTYSSLFSVCAKAGPIKGGAVLNKVLAEIDRHQVSLNSTSHNAMLSALVHCGRANEVFEQYLNMTDPTIETFGVLLLACAKGHNLDKVCETWSAIYESGLTPQLYCYNTLLLCLRDCTLPDHMTKQSSHVTVIPSNRKYLRATKEVMLSFQGETKPFTITLYISSKGIRWLTSQDINNILHLMRANKISPDIRTYTMLISLAVDMSCLTNSKLVEVDKTFVKVAITRRRQLGDQEGAKDLLDITHDFGLMTEDKYYLEKGRSCQSKQDAMNLLKEIKENGDVANISLYEVLINNRLKYNDYECVIKLLKDMKFNEVMPSDILMKQLESASSCPPKKRWLVHNYNGFKGYFTLWKRQWTTTNNELK